MWLIHRSDTRMAVADAMHGKVLYLLVLVIIVQTIYPITMSQSLAPQIIYQVLYGMLMVAGVIVARDTPRYARILAVLGVVWIVSAVIYTLNQTAVWAVLLGYGALVPFQTMLIWVLLRFIFLAHRVTLDILYASCAVYFLLGAVFSSVFGLIEIVTFSTTGGMHAFTDGVVTQGEILPWQHLLYFSYTTLTTAGYGDILPVSPWARSAANVEAIIGVLYTTIILARLVSLYSAPMIEAEVEEHIREEEAHSADKQ